MGCGFSKESKPERPRRLSAVHGGYASEYYDQGPYFDEKRNQKAQKELEKQEKERLRAERGNSFAGSTRTK